MGEYATYRGQSIKIGTCESMYYLRHDQRYAVTRESGNVDPVQDVLGIRFRFPWPDEDTCEPGGAFHDHAFDRGVTIRGLAAPAGVDHRSVQFRAESAGYLVSLPCSEGMAGSQPGLTAGAISVNGSPATIHRNGFRGAVQLVQQKELADGRVVPIFRCGGCGCLWRGEDQAYVEEAAALLRAEADQRERRKESGVFWHTIADRMLAGMRIGVSA